MAGSGAANQSIAVSEAFALGRPAFRHRLAILIIALQETGAFGPLGKFIITRGRQHNHLGGPKKKASKATSQIDWNIAHARSNSGMATCSTTSIPYID